MKAELKDIINILTALKDEDEFYIKSYAKEFIEAYAKQRVIEELESLNEKLMRTTDDDEDFRAGILFSAHEVRRVIKELKQE